jgi:HlyD family secretion protein
MARRASRPLLTVLAALLLGAALVAAFWPRPLLVDLGEVGTGPLIVTIDEDARTRVRDAYVVSTPIAGRLLRVEVEPGTPVVAGETVVARMLPTNPAALDVRTREQAKAAVAAAEAALQVAEADLEKARIDADLAETDLTRTRRLFETGTVAQAALDRAVSAERAANATLDTAHAAIAMREAEVQNARAQLIGFEDQGLASAIGLGADPAIPVTAPASGRVLRVVQQSETTLPAGAAILEIGDTEGDLEVVVDLLSTDAVQVRPGARVIITNWGGPQDLSGHVDRIDPFGFTKVSALGVEEQRVTAVIAFDGPREARAGLGHGFRVEARIVVYESGSATRVPAAALFRESGGWAAFRMVDGRAEKRRVEIGRSDGVWTEVQDGLSSGDTVVLYPPAGLADGQRIAVRSIE